METYEMIDIQKQLKDISATLRPVLQILAYKLRPPKPKSLKEIDYNAKRMAYKQMAWDTTIEILKTNPNYKYSRTRDLDKLIAKAIGRSERTARTLRREIEIGKSQAVAQALAQEKLIANEKATPTLKESLF